MSVATGLGPVETGVLEAYGTVGAGAGQSMVKNQRILAVLFRDHRVAPLFGYRTICDFARPYVSHLELVEFNGNYGSPDFSEASAKYTESRLSSLGEVALLAERGERRALPIGMINGTVHVDGPTPPFDPHRIVAGLLAVKDGASDAELIDTVGAASFPTGCHVDVDLAELTAGHEAVVRCEAHIDRAENGELVISRLPPRSSASDIASSIERRVRHASSDVLPIADLNDASFGSQTRIVVRLIDGADPELVVRQLRDMWGIHTTVNVELEAPLSTVLRTWVDRHGDIDLRKQLQPITEAAR
jgi:DNA gyrase/topoisomerase IV subunit A